jgi:bacillithiol biosynthesis cysteine-adding enzyme BshC
MQSEKLPLSDTRQFSSLLLDYLSGENKLRPFYDASPHPDSFNSQIEKKQLDPAIRNTLTDVLKEQYAGIETSNAVENNIRLLQSTTTYTITTGHQLNIFTGPMYFIYKILTAINLAETLKAAHPGYDFVPVYWMASEDHDFEEISHFRLFGKTYQWKSDQKGPVGRMNPHTLEQLLSQLPEIPDIFKKAYLGYDHMAQAMRCIVNDLFGAFGLLVLDADDARLKGMMEHVIIDDMTSHSSYALVNRTSEQLQQLGYSSQVNPRQINFFYMEDGLRERIVKEEDDHYTVLNTNINFTSKALTEDVQAHPEKYSPNVILRPLYQEIILPNLAYIGGPAEVAYWLQLKGIFDHFNVPFPIVMPRNFAMILNRPLVKKISKLGLSVHDLFKDPDEIKSDYLNKNAAHSFTLEEEKTNIRSLFEKITEKAAGIDGSLKGFIGSEEARTLKSLDNIAKRLKRSEEVNQETGLKQIDNLMEKLFPGGVPQERTDNFLNHYINHPDFIQSIKDQIPPFDYRYHVFLSHG